VSAGSNGIERKLFHTRQVTCLGYRRVDGLWDIEGEIVDTKTHRMEISAGRTFKPGDPIHRMRLRITADDDLVVREVEAHTDASPFSSCPDITGAYAQLVGLRIGPGFTAAARSRVGGAGGCTHITELLGPMATTAFQTIAGGLHADGNRDGVATRRSKRNREQILDSCYAFRTDGEVARKLFGPDAAKEHFEARAEAGASESRSDPKK
jgi:hypothetical protein